MSQDKHTDPRHSKCSDCYRTHLPEYHDEGNDLVENSLDANKDLSNPPLLPPTSRGSQPTDELYTKVAATLQISGVYPYPEFVKPLVEVVEGAILIARLNEAHIALGMNEGSQTAQLERIATLQKEIAHLAPSQEDRGETA